MAIENKGKDKWLLVVSLGYVDGKRQRHQEMFYGSKREAALAEKALALKLCRSPLKKESSRMTLGGFYQYWRANFAVENLRPNTVSLYDHLFQRTDAALGHKELNKIQPQHVLAFYKQLRTCQRHDGREGALSARTVHKYHEMLHRLFAQAVRWQMAASNPCDAVDPPNFNPDDYKKTILEGEDLQKFLNLLAGETTKHRLWGLMPLCLGLRRGELFGLRWKDVDFDKASLRISRQSIMRKGRVTLGPLKTKSSERVLSIPAGLVGLLSDYRKEQEEYKAALANKWAGAEEMADDFLFTTWNGLPACPDSITTWLGRFVKRHNLPKISPHSLRHMSATYLINAGIDVRTVANKLGHSRATTTITVYSHALKKSEEKTAEVMNKMIFGDGA